MAEKSKIEDLLFFELEQNVEEGKIPKLLSRDRIVYAVGLAKASVERKNKEEKAHRNGKELVTP